MKRVLSLALLGLFSISIVGCHASVDTDKPDSTDSSYKKTTTYNNDGTKTTKTETKVEH